jgi:hypothetical protein
VASQGAGLWVFLALAAALIQAAYAAYLWQLPDWGATASVAFMSLAFTAIYAALAAAFLLSRDGLAMRWMGIAPDLAGKSAPWCLIMLCLTALAAYSAGRISLKWRHDSLRAGI